MAEKHVAVCDQCGAEAPLQEHTYSGAKMDRCPVAWIILFEQVDMREPHASIDRWFCGPLCAARWLLDDYEAPDVPASVLLDARTALSRLSR